MIKRFKFTIIFILLSLTSPIFLTLITHGIKLLIDFVIIGAINAGLFLLFKNKIEILGLKRKVIIILTVIFSFLAPLIFLIAILFSPAQKEVDRILFDVCLPAIRKYYNVASQENLPQIPKDKNNNPKWWYQAMECEKNVANKKEATFSANPVNFKSVKQ